MEVILLYIHPFIGIFLIVFTVLMLFLFVPFPIFLILCIVFGFIAGWTYEGRRIEQEQEQNQNHQ